MDRSTGDGADSAEDSQGLHSLILLHYLELLRHGFLFIFHALFGCIGEM